MKPFLPLFFVLILLSVSVSSLPYPYLGYNQYVQGTGFFNEELDETSQGIAITTGAVWSPLVADLDNDGINEIVVLTNASTVRVYHDITLDLITTYSLNFSDAVLGKGYIPPYLFDMNGDNRTEIIIASAGNTNKIQILTYNSSGIFPLIQHDYSSGHAVSPVNGEAMLACKATQQCMLVYTQRSNSDGGNGIVSAFPFNTTTQLRGATTIFNTASVGACFPRIPTIDASQDFNNDGSTDYVFTFITPGSGSEVLYGFYVSTSTNATSDYALTHGQIFSQTLFNAVTANASGIYNCVQAQSGEQVPGNYITAPLVFDALPGSTKETIVGMMDSQTDHLIRVYSATGTTIDRHPQATETDGLIISNVFRTNAFRDSDTNREDYCVLGQLPTNTRLNLVCGSQVNLETLLETVEFDDNDVDFNVSTGYGDIGILTHSAQHTTVTSSGTNLDELVTSWGILRLDYGTDNVLTRIWAPPVNDGVVLSVDAGNVDRDDIIILTENNLYYVDDGFSNSIAEVANITTNPCFDATWEHNTTVQVTVRCFDTDDDTVSAWASLYYGEAVQQTINWTTFVNDNTNIAFTFIANVTTGVSTLRVACRDSENPTTNTTQDITFSVSSTGQSFGDSSCTSGFDVGEPDTPTPTPGGNLTGTDSISESITFIQEVSGLTPLMIWLILMILIAVGIWMYGHEEHLGSTLSFGLIAFVEFLMVVLGVLLGAIGIGTVIAIVVVSSAIIGLLVIRPIISGGSRGG